MESLIYLDLNLDSVVIMVIEWNAHIFSPDTGRYPLHENAAYQPEMSHHPEDPLAAYIDHMENEGVDRAIIVHPEPYGDAHHLVLECLKREPERLKGTSLYYPNDSDAPKKLADLVAQEPRIIATRFHAHRGKEMYLDSFSERGVRALWEKAVELGLIVELHIGPNYAHQLNQALRDIPETVALIDHLAEPHMGHAFEYAEVLELAAHENTYMKLSGLNHFATDSPYYESVIPFTRRVIREFGPNRMVWGSGTPAIVDKHMADYSDKDRANVKGLNLMKLLKWN